MNDVTMMIDNQTLKDIGNMNANVNSEKSLCDTLKKILTPTLLLLGIAGNLISMRIFSTNRSMRRQTTFRYLKYLSILDLLVLVFGYGHTFVQVYTSVDVRLMSNAMCKGHSFLVYLFSHSSSLILVCMSVDRALSIVWSKYSRNTPTRLRTSKYMLGAILFLVAIANSHFILFAEIIDYNFNETSMSSTTHVQNESTITSNVYKICYGRIDSNYFIYLVKIFPWLVSFGFYYLLLYIISLKIKRVDMLTYAFVPFTIMLMCSMIIIYKLYSTKSSERVKAKTFSQKSATSNTNAHNDHNNHNNHNNHNEFMSRAYSLKKRIGHGSNRQKSKRQNSLSKQTQITSILLTTNFIFVSLVSPLLFMNALNMLQEDTLKTTLVYFLSYANHGLNFIFYGISCQKYRKEFLDLLNRYSHRCSFLFSSSASGSNWSSPFHQNQNEKKQANNNKDDQNIKSLAAAPPPPPSMPPTSPLKQDGVFTYDNEDIMMVVASQQNENDNEYLSRANYHKLKNKLYLSLMLSDYDDDFENDNDDERTRGDDLDDEKKKKKNSFCFKSFSLFISNKKKQTTTKNTKKKIKFKDKFCYVSSVTLSREIVRI